MTGSFVERFEVYGSNDAGGYLESPDGRLGPNFGACWANRGAPGDLSDDVRNRWKRGLRAVSGTLVGSVETNFSDFGEVGRI